MQEAVNVCLEAQLFNLGRGLARDNLLLQAAVEDSEAAYLVQHADAAELAAAGDYKPACRFAIKCSLVHVR